MKICDFEERETHVKEKENERGRTKARDRTGNKETMGGRRTKKERALAAGVWRNERKREAVEDLEEGRERERSGMRKKEQQIDRRQREAPARRGVPFVRKLSSRPPWSRGSLHNRPSSRLAPSFLLLFLPLFFLRSPRVLPCHDPYPTISLAPLEARQMSGIRLRHLSVSSSVTFDSRQIERRARQEREEERKRGAAFYCGAR